MNLNLPHQKAIVSLDFETALTSGEASVEFYRPDFRVTSCAISWYDTNNVLRNIYLEKEEFIVHALSALQHRENLIIVHNLAFEYGVLKYRFPKITLNWHADTMRLTQLADGGSLGLSLEACTKRWLPPESHNHKAPYYAYLRETHAIRKGKEGANLHLLPPDMLEAYNVADTNVTLDLYVEITKYFKSIKYDWSFDHQLYTAMCRLVSDSRGAGIKVDRDKLAKSKESLQQDLKALNQGFRDHFAAQIAEIEQENLTALCSRLKTEKGQLANWEKAIDDPKITGFKTSSTAHKKRLFVDKLGLEPKFYTTKGAPSFAKKLLRQWGEGGQMLIKRGTIFQALTQVKRLSEKSEYDGRWHVGLKVAGTTTGRMAGTDGLNIQAMARREERLMGALIPEDDHVFVSVDLSAGEPSVITHFSKDPYYKAAIFDMVGKAPYYDESGVLMIDDIYLMGMSISPMGADKLHDIYHNHQFVVKNTQMNFADAWITDADIVKKFLNEDRAFHKILILGIGYAMGPEKMVLSAFQAGFDLSLKEARQFFKAYWKLIKNVKGLSEMLTEEATRTGYLVNTFGYRSVPDPFYKSLNYFIQSSINGLISCLAMKYAAICPYAQFVTVIHDEIIYMIRKDKLAEAKVLWDNAVKSLNDDLGWSVQIRSGWAEGNNLYEAK